MKRYEINDEVQELVINMERDAYRLMNVARALRICKSAGKEFFQTVISTAETLGKEAEKLRQITYGKSEE